MANVTPFLIGFSYTAIIRWQKILNLMDKLEKFGQFGNYHFWFPVSTTEHTVPLLTAKM